MDIPLLLGEQKQHSQTLNSSIGWYTRPYFVQFVAWASSDANYNVSRRKGSLTCPFIFNARSWLVSQLLFIASLLSGAIAESQRLPPAARSAEAVVHYYTKNSNCGASGNSENPAASSTTTIRQDRCINIPSFLSYKPWQPIRIEEYAYCYFNIFPEENCGGEVRNSADLPATEDKAACLDASIGYGETGLEGSKSVRFNCEYFPPPGYQVKDKRPQRGHRKQPPRTSQAARQWVCEGMKGVKATGHNHSCVWTIGRFVNSLSLIVIK